MVPLMNRTTLLSAMKVSMAFLSSGVKVESGGRVRVKMQEGVLGCFAGNTLCRRVFPALTA